MHNYKVATLSVARSSYEVAILAYLEWGGLEKEWGEVAHVACHIAGETLITQVNDRILRLTKTTVVTLHSILIDLG